MLPATDQSAPHPLAKPADQGHPRPPAYDTAYTITIAFIIPLVSVSLVAAIVYLAWGRGMLERRKKERLEERVALRKLGGWEGEGEGEGESVVRDGGGRAGGLEGGMGCG